MSRYAIALLALSTLTGCMIETGDGNRRLAPWVDSEDFAEPIIWQQVDSGVFPGLTDAEIARVTRDSTSRQPSRFQQYLAFYLLVSGQSDLNKADLPAWVAAFTAG